MFAWYRWKIFHATESDGTDSFNIVIILLALRYSAKLVKHVIFGFKSDCAIKKFPQRHQCGNFTDRCILTMPRRICLLPGCGINLLKNGLIPAYSLMAFSSFSSVIPNCSSMVRCFFVIGLRSTIPAFADREIVLGSLYALAFAKLQFPPCQFILQQALLVGDLAIGIEQLLMFLELPHFLVRQPRQLMYTSIARDTIKVSPTQQVPSSNAGV